MSAGYLKDPLWLKLEDMKFDEPGPALPFVRRLQAETGWTSQAAAAAIGEYRRFIYLACRVSRPISPPPHVDEVWKLHSMFTRHYWGVMCETVIERPLHYQSTAEIDAELQERDPSGDQIQQSYEKSYEKIFGESPLPESYDIKARLSREQVFICQALLIVAGITTFVGLRSYDARYASVALGLTIILAFAYGLIANLWAVGSLIRAIVNMPSVSGCMQWLRSNALASQRSCNMDYRTDSLWLGLQNMPLEVLGTKTSPFKAELARTTGWSKEHCLAAIEEYRKFLYLAARAGHRVTPSETVDEVWHLHLTHSRHYWDDLCEGLLRRPLHHDPATGKEGEELKLLEQYSQTLHSYRTIFGQIPSRNLWGPPIRQTAHHTFNSGYLTFSAALAVSLFMSDGNVFVSGTISMFLGVSGVLLSAFGQDSGDILYRTIRRKRLWGIKGGDSGFCEVVEVAEVVVAAGVVEVDRSTPCRAWEQLRSNAWKIRQNGGREPLRRCA